ncbi:terminase family protein [Candidatus Dojkabacteria bacterium]|jgi:hypothetical protein|nr:terminase family protein [Candidatus Dojkabacteria bacterium]
MKISELDPWQKEYLECRTHKVLVSGRQTGKSEVAAIDNAEEAINYKNSICLIISKTERQAEELLQKTYIYLLDNYPKYIDKKGNHKPTKSRVWLKNGSRIISLPVGEAGEGVRFLTVTKLTVDEAQLPKDEVYNAVTPMLLTTGGQISLLGTPQGKQGYFWNAFKNELGQFKVFHINSEEVITNRPISESWPDWRRQASLAHLAQEKQRMTAKWYAQEYLGIFVEDLLNLIPYDLIKKCCSIKRDGIIRGKTYLGVDCAGMGEDENAFSVVDKLDKDHFRQIENIKTKKELTTDTSQKVINLSIAFNVKKIGVDDGGVGFGVFSELLNNPKTRDKTIALNNSSRPLDKSDKPKFKRILKEEMYFNLLNLMEKGQIKLLDDDELIASLSSVQYERNEQGKLIIFGNYTHQTESLIRACWLAVQDTSLNLWAV